MARRAWSVLASWSRRIARLEDTPPRTALAFSLGVFVAFLPVLGLQTLVALALAFLLRLNRVAVLLGTLVNNPWTVLLIDPPGLLLGRWLLGGAPGEVPPIDWRRAGSLAFWREAADLLAAWLPQLVLGTLILGLAAAAVSYLLVWRLILARRSAGAAAGTSDRLPPV
jgi:uncharacterized protein (DUF2062 family)